MKNKMIRTLVAALTFCVPTVAYCEEPVVSWICIDEIDDSTGDGSDDTFDLGYDEIIINGDSQYDRNVKLEGDGFDTAEEAAIAYVEALGENDIEKMLSTFAIETYAEHCSFENTLETTTRWSSFYNVVPFHNDYASQLNKYTRAAEIITQIKNCYNQAAIAANSESYLDCSTSYSLGLETTAEEFMEDNLGEPFWINADFSDIHVIEWDTIDFFSQAYEKVNDGIMARNISSRNARSGADELKSVVVGFGCNGDQCYQTMDVIRYGDKWYNETCMGIIACYCNLNTYWNGLINTAYIEE